MKLLPKNVKKRNLFFSFGGIFVPAQHLHGVPREKTLRLLSSLSELQSHGLVELFLILGQERRVIESVASGSGVLGFFRPENVFFVTKEYIESKAEVDRERHVAQLEKDPGFVDEFFKQRVITDLVGSGKVFRENSVLVGHDIWFDAFYTSRFSGVDYVLVREALSERGVPSGERMACLNLVDFDERDFKKIILGKMPRHNPALLQNFVFGRLKKEFISGADLSGIVNKTVEKAAQKKRLAGKDS